MPFLPSLLEYSPDALKQKLELIKNYPEEFQTIQKSLDGKIYLHLDFVLPEFASERKVEAGNSPQVVFDLIHQYFQDQKVVCNCHFMRTKGDTDEVKKFFETYNWNPNWEYIFYVGQEFVEMFEKEIGLSLNLNPVATQQPLIKGQIAINLKNQIDLRIGAWLDLDQYNSETNFELQDYLLMTVYAGKSGQKLTPEVRANTLQIVKNNHNLSFAIDGGWTVVDELNELNLEQKNKLNIVSYSSFWKELEKILEN